MAALDDDVEDNGFVYEVGEDARKRHEPPGFRIAEREDEIGVFHDAPYVREFPAAAPLFPLKHAPKLVDVVARGAADEVQFGFEGRDHEAPSDGSSRTHSGISRRRERMLAASFRDMDIPNDNGRGYGKYRCRSIEM